MRVLLFGFLLTFTVGISAQSPMVTKLFSDATTQANAGRFKDALESYKRALLVAESEYLDTGYRAKLHYNLGVCHFQLDEIDPAISQFKSAVLLKTDYTRAHYALGMARMRKRAWKSATVSFTNVVDVDPKNGEAWFDLALAALALNDLKSAEEAFARSIIFSSRDAALSHNNIGVILAVKGDLASAETQFENAIAMSSGRLIEAKRNLEFCRAKRAPARELIAGEFQYAKRESGLLRLS